MEIGNRHLRGTGQQWGS